MRRRRATALFVLHATAALLPTAGLRAQPPRAQVGPLRAWVARGDSGACQLELHNTGTSPVVAWTVTVRSEQARHVTVFRHDGWRDEFHLPASALQVPPGFTKAFTVDEAAAAGALVVRIHLLVLGSNVAHGMREGAAHIGAADEELGRLTARRQAVAAEARQITDRVEAALRERGIAAVLSTRLTSSILESDGDWNWWRIAEAAKAAEAKAADDPDAAAGLRAALDLLRDAHRVGMAPVTLIPAEPMQAAAVGTCTPE